MQASYVSRTRAIRLAALAALVSTALVAPDPAPAASPSPPDAEVPAPAPTEPAAKLSWRSEIESPTLTFWDWLGNPAGLPAPRHSEIEALLKRLAATDTSIKDLLQTMVNHGKISFKRAQAHLDSVARPSALSLERWDALHRQLDAHQLADADYAAAIFQFHQLARDLQFRQASLLAQVRSAVADNTELPGDPVQPDTGRPQTAARTVSPTMPPDTQKHYTLPPVQGYTPPPQSPYFQR